jgi:hypothetical protein
MDIAIILSAFGALLLGFLGKLVASEIHDLLPSLARSMVRRAVARLPLGERERYLEEWSADLEAYPGKLARLFRAAGCIYGARTLAKELDSKRATRGNISCERDDNAQKKQFDLTARHALINQLVAQQLDPVEDGFRGSVTLHLSRELRAALERFPIPIEQIIELESSKTFISITTENYERLRYEVVTAFRASVDN